MRPDKPDNSSALPYWMMLLAVAAGIGGVLGYHIGRRAETPSAQTAPVQPQQPPQISPSGQVSLPSHLTSQEAIAIQKTLMQLQREIREAQDKAAPAEEAEAPTNAEDAAPEAPQPPVEDGPEATDEAPAPNESAPEEPAGEDTSADVSPAPPLAFSPLGGGPLAELPPIRSSPPETFVAAAPPPSPQEDPEPQRDQAELIRTDDYVLFRKPARRTGRAAAMDAAWEQLLARRMRNGAADETDDADEAVGDEDPLKEDEPVELPRVLSGGRPKRAPEREAAATADAVSPGPDEDSNRNVRPIPAEQSAGAEAQPRAQARSGVQMRQTRDVSW